MGIETLAGILISNLILMGIERWFGETDKTEANSIAKFAENAVVKGVKKLLKKA